MESSGGALVLQDHTVGRRERLTSTIILVEDEALVRMVVAEDFRDAGYVVIECSSGDEAWDLLMTGAEVDLLFSDVHMPGRLDGLALATVAREKMPDLPIIIASGRLPAIKAAAYVFMVKPFSSEAALHHIAHLLNADRHGLERA